ncbi:MAG TPA: preprotein translocase subunit SecG [Thiobacillaceae bacterium]|nr:preprotein translocase subunit SecG [Thiobacillaceae bacterium]
METLVWIVHLLVAAALIGLVLLQHGKGADMGAAFGSGASGSLFGASGSANFLSRATAVLATVFFFTSMGLTYFSLQNTKPTDVMQRRVAPPAQKAPAPAVAPLQAPTGNTANPDSKAGEIPK